jgi:hypothetical protein
MRRRARERKGVSHEKELENEKETVNENEPWKRKVLNYEREQEMRRIWRVLFKELEREKELENANEGRRTMPTVNPYISQIPHTKGIKLSLLLSSQISCPYI